MHAHAATPRRAQRTLLQHVCEALAAGRQHDLVAQQLAPIRRDHCDVAEQPRIGILGQPALQVLARVPELLHLRLNR